MSVGVSLLDCLLEFTLELVVFGVCGEGVLTLIPPLVEVLEYQPMFALLESHVCFAVGQFTSFLYPRDGRLQVIGTLVKVADFAVVVDVLGGLFYASVSLLDEGFQSAGIGYCPTGLLDGLGFVLILQFFAIVVRLFPFPLVQGDSDRGLLE